MYLSKIISVFVAVIFMTSMTPSEAVSQSPESALVKHRQSMMKQMGRTFRVFVPIIKGENENLNDAVVAASTVHTLANQLPDVFPGETGRDAVKESRAKPEVWANKQEFDQATQNLIEESRKLIEAASANQMEPFQTQFQAFVRACNGCHDGKGSGGGKFRYPRE